VRGGVKSVLQHELRVFGGGGTDHGHTQLRVLLGNESFDVFHYTSNSYIDQSRYVIGQ
jgi:hypothetical protein